MQKKAAEAANAHVMQQELILFSVYPVVPSRTEPRFSSSKTS